MTDDYAKSYADSGDASAIAAIYNCVRTSEQPTTTILAATTEGSR
jgi:hypothetical protein